MLTRLIHADAVYTRMDRQEAVPVPESHREMVYYHGTSSTKIGEQIIREGELHPGDSRNYSMSPVPGRVYLTPSLNYVSAYVCGGVCNSNDVQTLMQHGGQYGYLFVVKGTDLVDLIPDEDTLGTLLCKDRPDWLRSEFERLLEENRNTWKSMSDMAMQESMDVEEEYDDPDFSPEFFEQDYNFLQNVYECSFPEIAIAGKFLLEYMDEDEMVELMEEMSFDKGNAVSHDGSVKFSEAWRFDKKYAPELREDGSNFFELAERIK